MNILLLCGCLEAGKDGVGDYTRLLATAFTEKGHNCYLVALNDPYVESVETTATGQLSSLRCSHLLHSTEQQDRFNQIIAEWQPDILSLQFVPYSFHPRGLINDLVKFVSRIPTTCKWHIMFHEIWIGCANKAPLKERIIGCLQRRQIKKLLHVTRPLCIHSHTPAYRYLIDQLGLTSHPLELFGNIPRQPQCARQWLFDALAQQGVPNIQKARKHWFLFGIFGTLHPQWPPEPLLYYLEAAAQKAHKRAVLISFGHNASGQDIWQSLSQEQRGCLQLVRLGPMASDKVSQLMNSLDFGIATSPWSLIHKSGSVRAMLEHGLPVLMNRDDITFRGFEHKQAPLPHGVYWVDETLPDTITTIGRFEPQSHLSAIAQQMLTDVGVSNKEEVKREK